MGNAERSQRDVREVTLRQILRSLPVVADTARRARHAVRSRRFQGSANYWEQRYQSGGDSGAGSYGRLAEFKAEVLNQFVAEHGVRTVLELGCGDGAQLQLADYPRYTGVDVAPACVERCRQLFSDDPTKTFRVAAELDQVGPHELGLSLDVVYHLVEDEVFEQYIRDLFGRSTRFAIVYASNFDGPHDSPHVRHRNFTAWMAENLPGWVLDERIPNRFPAMSDSDPAETSFADFYVYRAV